MPTDIYRAIADPNRREMLQLLARGGLSVNGLSKHFDISRPAVSKHLRILTECGLIQVHRRGRERICEAQPAKLKEITDWAESCRKVWIERLNALGKYLDHVQKKHRPAVKRIKGKESYR